MDKLRNFLSKPRNLYFSIIAMLTVVTGLVSISFSYYVDESSEGGVIKLNAVDNRIQSDDLVNGAITLLPNETKEITLYVMSNNNFDSKYKLSYISGDGVMIFSDKEFKENIEESEVQSYTLTLVNFADSARDVKLVIDSAHIDEVIKTENKLIEIKRND